MSEWIKFTFSSDDDFRSFLKITLDGTVQDFDDAGDSPGIMYVGGDRNSLDMWCEVDDDHANATDSHTCQIDVTDWQGDAKSSVNLDSITLGDQVHTPDSGSINAQVTRWNVIDAEYQGWINDGTVVSDSVTTADIGSGSQSYSKSTWADSKVIGEGAWQLAFTCPYLDWYTTVHND